MQDDRQSRKPRAHDDPDLERRRLPGRERHQGQRNGDQHADARPVTPPSRRLVAQQQRRLDEPHLQQRHDREQQRDQHADADALHRSAPRDAVMRLRQDRRGRSERERNRGDRTLRHADAQEAPGEPERHHLQDVDRDDLAAASADAFQDGDAADLLEDEHARHARHRDAAEDDDDQPDEAEIVLGAIEVPSDLIFGGAVRPGVDELFLEVFPQREDQRLDALLGHLDQDHAARAAAEPEQPGGRQVVVVDDHTRAEAELAHPASRLLRDETANRERRLADGDLIAHTHADRRQQLRADERAVALDQCVGIRLPALQIHAAVQRKRLLHGAQFRHFRHRPRTVRRPHHRRCLDGLGAFSTAGVRQAALNRLARLRGPVPAGPNQDVGGDQGFGFGAEYAAHALDHRPERDDRRDADRDADEEEEQAPPGRACFAHRHPQDEHHRVGSFFDELSTSGPSGCSP